MNPADTISRVGAPDLSDLPHVAEARARVTRLVAEAVIGSAVLFCAIAVAFGKDPRILLVNAGCIAAAIAARRMAARGYHPSTDRLLIAAVVATLTLDSLLELQIGTLALYTPVILFTMAAEESRAWRWGQVAFAFAQMSLVLYLVSAAGGVSALADNHVAVETVHGLFVGVACVLIYLGYRHHGRRLLVLSEAQAAEVAERVAVSRGIAEEQAATTGELRRANAEAEASLLQQRSLQGQLASTREQLEQFARAASHDLKEPIRTIRSFAQLLRREVGKAAVASAVAPADRAGDLAEHFAFVDAACATMQTLLERLLVYQRTVAALEAEDARVPIAVAELWREALKAADCPRDTPVRYEDGARLVVLGHRPSLVRLLAEVIGNAVKFCGSDTRVTCVAHRGHGGEVRVTVADEGIGIDAAYHEYVFGMFKRLHPREAYPGAGLGLALARRIAEGHGGSISLDAVPGEGTVVTVSLAEATP